MEPLLAGPVTKRLRATLRFVGSDPFTLALPSACGLALTAVALVGSAQAPADPSPNGPEQVEPEQVGAKISPAGAWLARFLDRTDVEHRWLAGHEHVAWRSGLELREEHGKTLTPLAQTETHCSAFAAAVATDLGVELLHPPEHSHVLLANAQYDWLGSTAGRSSGWRRVADPIEAQHYANQGELVVAIYKNPNPTKSGHIAVVRLEPMADDTILDRGPQITQAGVTNYRSIDLKTGFIHHPGAWLAGGAGEVAFYAHPLDGAVLAGE